MRWLRDRLDRIAPNFERGGRLHRWHPLWEAMDTFLYSPGSVTRTGSQTEFGRIGRALRDQEPPRTRLQREFDRLVVVFALVALAAAVTVVVVYGAGDEAWKFHQLSDLQKQAAIAGSGPARWLALLPPQTPDKDLEQALADPATLDLLDNADAAALAPLQAALGKAAPGAAA